MNQHLKTLAVSAVAAALLAASLSALAQQAPPKPEVLIKWRQSAYQVIAWNVARIKASVDGPQFNKDEVVKSAQAIAALSNTNLPGLFAPGTEQGKGWHDTAARPDVFKDSKRFSELYTHFSKEATELASVAASGDAAAVKAQYTKLTQTCKACHDDFKTKE